MDQDRRYEQAMVAHGDAVARLARAIEADPQRREELVQEICVQVWRSLASWDGRCSERTWVLRVAHNVAASHVDRERRRVRTHPEAAEAGDDGRALAELERRQAVAVVHRWVRELPLLDRQVALLFLEGLAPVEIAEVVGASANAISVRLTRVKAALAERWMEAGHG
ncbi:MAG: RNA polymerase sigma factor [Myxococcales bacterium]|nr:RNA polymerase sigma factor [Myxococcales bacterium]MCA9566594.1 RNA polymerase sigma factor [Myxococcales bacterium]